MSPPIAIGSIDFSASQHVDTSKPPLATIDELIRARAEEMGDLPMLGYPNEGLLDFEEHSAKSCDLYADAAAQKLKQLGLSEVDPSLTKPPVIGILAQSGFHVIATTFALFRLGYTVFFISTRLPSPAIVQLLKLTDCNTVLSTPTYDAVLAEAGKVREIRVLPLLQHSDYYGVAAPRVSRVYDPDAERKKIAIILHSSGSTGLPKPIFLSNGNCLSTFATNMGMKALITSPLFHAHGVLELFRSIHSRKPLYLTNFKLPLTGSGLVQVLNHIQPELLHSVPYIIKLLAESEEGVRALAAVKMVLYAGSGCPDSLGDLLTEKGVYLVGNYGSTETGRLMTSARYPDDKDWSYLRLIKPSEPYVLMDEISPGLYECVALDGLPSKSTINSDNPPNSFRTRDLFTRHKSRPGLWKYASRLDDRFTLINGEKVLPLPIEGHVRQNRYVRDAIVFGEGKECPGMLVIPADNAAGLSNEEFFDKVWPVVEEANSRAETYSRISRELVVIMPTDTIFPQTDKNTFIRLATYKKFASEIEQAYANFEPAQGGSLKLSGEELENFLILNLKIKLGATVEAEDDLFAAGVDSLMCIQLRNIIRTKLDLGGRHADLGQNIIYETGSVRGLAKHLEALREGTSVEINDELQVMQDLIDRYSTFTPHKGSGKPCPSKEVVLLTGATGGLGAHMLAQLVSKPNVSAVWTVVRAKSDEAGLDRILQSLSTRGLELSPEEKQKVIPIAGDLGQPDLGLGPTRLADLRSTLTLVIHSAWAVNFNIPVQSFEGQHIKGVHNLIQLCLSVDTASPARFFFCSSVSAGAGSPRPGTVSEAPIATPALAQKTGYGRSKYVGEHITINAARKSGVPARVLRIGQLVADTRVGEWNATEGMALMIQTAKTTGALPQLDEQTSWLPVDLAATTSLELTGVIGGGSLEQVTKKTAADTDLVYHVLNPRRFNYAKELHPALREAGLEFEALPPTEWMERLRSSEKDPSKNPPIKLLQWFESKYGTGKSGQAGDDLLYLTDKTQRDSPTLQKLPDVTETQYVKKMLERLQRYW
ncbi:putative secondary metabolism biosynthetic enzyme [Neopestalotiopsis sp. 37M]|nr:putative secondary metabolism biosynthetic enzyme [Neopestalotiopsis sp. 37M]